MAEAPATFGDTLNNIVNTMNDTQQAEDVVTERYERGEMTDISAMFFVGFLALLLIEQTDM
ncbi:flagellar hook-basal body complex protein FliE [Sphingomonas sp. TX0543]|uniref:flagellar hook-basal body complex protein FliE n=1 Tax=Sphingomonas sp. TX0543 TaxID=3399682 RepID=UPI003AFB33CC